MSDPIEASGGTYVDPARWLEVARSTGYDVEFAPEDDTPIIGGELRIRLAHPSLAEGQPVFVSLDMDLHVPARNAPPVVLEEQRQQLALLRELDAPWVVIAHRMMAVGWLSDGRGGMELALHDFITERRAARADHEELAEWMERLQRAKRPEATMPQSVLFRSHRRTEAQIIAERLLAASFAHVSGGTYRDVAQEPIPGPRVMEPSIFHAALNLDLEAMRAAGTFRPETPFERWSEHPPE
jgi:hypothetical protein